MLWIFECDNVGFLQWRLFKNSVLIRNFKILNLTTYTLDFCFLSDFCCSLTTTWLPKNSVLEEKNPHFWWWEWRQGATLHDYFIYPLCSISTRCLPTHSTTTQNLPLRFTLISFHSQAVLNGRVSTFSAFFSGAFLPTLWSIRWQFVLGGL